MPMASATLSTRPLSRLATCAFASSSRTSTITCLRPAIAALIRASIELLQHPTKIGGIRYEASNSVERGPPSRHVLKQRLASLAGRGCCRGSLALPA